MRVASTLLLLGLLGCTKAATTSEPIGNSPPGAKPPPAAAMLDIQITSVALASDCHSATAPAAPSMPPPTEEAKRAHRSEAEADMDYAEARRACEQTSMQLAVTGSASGAPIKIGVKKVELYDDKGALIGELTSRNPTVWAEGRYGAWDQTVAPKQALNVSYHLSAPNWLKVGNRWDRRYTLKAVITVGSTDRSVQREVLLAAPASLPADVET